MHGIRTGSELTHFIKDRGVETGHSWHCAGHAESIAGVDNGRMDEWACSVSGVVCCTEQTHTDTRIACSERDVLQGVGIWRSLWRSIHVIPAAAVVAKGKA